LAPQYRASEIAELATGARETGLNFGNTNSPAGSEIQMGVILVNHAPVF
jgi:hypothetical protein